MNYQTAYSLYCDPPSIEKLRAETFKGIGRVHDWRNYIAPITQELWAQYTDEQLLGLWSHAESLSELEEWD